MGKNKIIKLTNVVNSLSLSKQQRDIFIDFIKDVYKDKNIKEFNIECTKIDDCYAIDFNKEHNIIVSEENRIINDTNLYDYCFKHGTHNVIVNINGVKLNAFVNITVPNTIKYCIVSGTQETVLIPLIVVNNK